MLIADAIMQIFMSTFLLAAPYVLSTTDKY